MGKSSRSLSKEFPALVLEWHKTKNPNLSPDSTPPGSRKKVWWVCAADRLHEWEASPKHRTLGQTGCPFCSGRRVCETNSLATQNPELAKEWSCELNKGLTPHDVTTGSQRRVWWKCTIEPNHVWETDVAHRAGGTGCPYCAGRVVCTDNCLATKSPQLAREWSNRNDFTPFDITAGSSKMVWWRCEKNLEHEWRAPPYRRTGDLESGCPFCTGNLTNHTNSLSTTHPDIAEQWHPTENLPLTAEMVTAGTNKEIMWICKSQHTWRAAATTRIKGHGCPYCSGLYASADNSLSSLRPDLMLEWHPTKNEGLDPEAMTRNSHTQAWWRCLANQEHEWLAVVYSRNAGHGCPHCQKSKGEQAIENWLKRHEVQYIPQSRFDGCRLERRLPFDFWLPERKVCIEYDGDHHFKESRWYKQRPELLKTGYPLVERRDSIKTSYCLANNIALLRIPYWELKSIDRILLTYLGA